MPLIKKLTTFFSSEIFFVLFFSLLLLGLSLTPEIKRNLDTPRGQVWSHLEFYSDDYSIYVSNMLQGQRGRWTLLDKHTSEIHQGTIIHDEYLLWGKFVGFFGFDQFFAYHSARIVFGFILLITLYFFLKELFPKNPFLRKLAFFLITFSTGFIIATQTAKGWQLDFHMNWLTEMDVFYRFVALPHYLLGNIFFLGALISFLKFLKLPAAGGTTLESRASTPPEPAKAGKGGPHFPLITAAFCSIMLALIHPVALVSLMAMLAIYLLFDNFFKLLFTFSAIIKKPLNFIFSPPNIFFFVSLASALPIMIYYKYLMTIPPWNHMAAWEGVTQYHVPLTEFALAIGPTFFLGLLGFLVLLSKINLSCFRLNPQTKLAEIKLPLQKLLILFSWIFSFYVLIYFSYPFLTISQVRFTQVFIFIPFGILAAEAIVFLTQIFNSSPIPLTSPKFPIFPKIPNWLKSHLVLGTAIFFLIVNAAPYYYQSLNSKYRFFSDFSPLVYPYSQTVDGYLWLKKNTNPDDVVLTGFLAGTQVPYFSGNTVYVGHFWATLNREAKNVLVNKFLKNEMTESEALNFFKTNRIRYYFHGWQEASYGVNVANYKFLTPVYTNPMVTIYKVED